MPSLAVVQEIIFQKLIEDVMNDLQPRIRDWNVYNIAKSLAFTAGLKRQKNLEVSSGHGGRQLLAGKGPHSRSMRNWGNSGKSANKTYPTIICVHAARYVLETYWCCPLTSCLRASRCCSCSNGSGESLRNLPSVLYRTLRILCLLQ